MSTFPDLRNSSCQKSKLHRGIVKSSLESTNRSRKIFLFLKWIHRFVDLQIKNQMEKVTVQPFDHHLPLWSFIKGKIPEIYTFNLKWNNMKVTLEPEEKEQRKLVRNYFFWKVEDVTRDYLFFLDFSAWIGDLIRTRVLFAVYHLVNAEKFLEVELISQKAGF